MIELFLGAALIAGMRICDVTIGTIRTILVVQGRKYLAGLAGFFEVLIWLTAIGQIMKNLNSIPNILGYAIGYGLGNVIGITIEQKIGLGFVQLNIISRHSPDKIADILRAEKYGVTILPAEGGSGGTAVIITIIPRKFQKKVINLIETVDKGAFITVQSSLPFRGFISQRK